MNGSRLPQLLMRLSSLNGVPATSERDGVTVRRAKQDDEEALAHLLSRAFGQPWSAEDVQSRLTRCSEVDAVFVAEEDGILLATASARICGDAFPRAGYVHWVATAPAARGRGLARACVQAVLRHFTELGLLSAVLETDEDRLPAIAMYLGLGFQPAMRHPSDKDRWEKVLSLLDREKHRRDW